MTNSDSGTVTPINLATNTAGTPINVGLDPEGIAVTPNGATVYVASDMSGSLTAIATATNTPSGAIPIGANPSGVAITPDGKTVWVTNGSPTNTVTPLNVATNVAWHAHRGGIRSSDVVVTPDGKTVYVVDEAGGTVTPISTATDTAGTSFAIGTEPAGHRCHPRPGPDGRLHLHGGDPGQPDHLQRLGLELSDRDHRLLRLELR